MAANATQKLVVPAAFVEQFRLNALGVLSADADQLEGATALASKSRGAEIEEEAKALFGKIAAGFAVLEEHLRAWAADAITSLQAKEVA